MTGLQCTLSADQQGYDLDVSIRRDAQGKIVFTFEDLKRSFGYDSDNSAYSKIRRMMANSMISKSKETGMYIKTKKLISD